MVDVGSGLIKVARHASQDRELSAVYMGSFKDIKARFQ